MVHQAPAVRLIFRKPSVELHMWLCVFGVVWGEGGLQCQVDKWRADMANIVCDVIMYSWPEQGNHHYRIQPPPPCTQCKLQYPFVCTFIGKWASCYRKNTTSTSCRMWQSPWLQVHAVCVLADGRKPPAVQVNCSWSCRTNMSTGCSGMQQPNAGSMYILSHLFPITEKCLSGKDNTANAMCARIKYTRDIVYKFPTPFTIL